MIKTLINPKKTILLLFFGVMAYVSYPQFVPSPEDQYIEGEEFILSEEYSEALPYFWQLYEKGYKTANIAYKIGYCYLFIPGKKENALELLEKAVKKASGNYTGNSLQEENAPLDALLYLGMAYRISHKWEECNNILNILKDSVAQDSELYAKADFELKRCEHAQELVAAEIILRKTPLNNNINTTVSNFNPLVNKEETLIYYMDALKFYDAVMKSVKTSGNWTIPDNLTANLRSDGDYLVTGMSEDGNQLLLQLYDPYTRGDIYLCEYNDGKWGKITKLNENINTRYNETHASFANNGKTLYFTSNRPGSYGGLDIYRSDKTGNGDWGPAVNAGPTVNTVLNEETPFVTSNGKRLWFSSQGRYNMGGYDIFMSETDENNNWSYSVNVGYPLNTADDDLFYYPLNDGTIGYHAKYSDNIFGSMDIFRYEILSKANPARFKLRGQLKAKEEGSIPYGRINLAMVDIVKNDTINKLKPEENGRYFFKLPSGKYELNIYADEKYIDKKNISLPEYLDIEELIVDTEIDEKLLTEHLRPKEVTAEVKTTVTYTEPMQADTFIIRYILFGFDRFALAPSEIEYLSDIMTLLNKYPEIGIMLNGYTDAIGDESYNKALSIKRAGYIKNLMVTKNIKENRISVNGFGEDSPVALNNFADGKDNPLGRKFNRRVEIIFEKVPENLIVIYRNNIPVEMLPK